MSKKFYIFFLLSVCVISFIPAVQAEQTILIPTDDAYILANLQDTEDDQELRNFNSGNLDHLKVGYNIDTETKNSIVSISLLKFDLSNLSEKDIGSAKLRLYVDAVKLTTPQEIGLYLVNDIQWDESTITYDTVPPFSDLITSAMINSTHWYEWELGDSLKNKAGESIGFMLSFVTVHLDDEEIIIFTSKDSSSDYYPTLIIDSMKSISNIVNVMPTDDTFIGLDLSTFDDVYDLRNSNFGDAEFIKVWYSNNVTSTKELIITSGLLQFDLSDIDVDNIVSVNLKIKTSRIDSSGADKVLSVSKLNNTSWSESELTFANHPPSEISDSFIVEMTQPELWHSWDVTSIVKENDDSKLALSISYDRTFPGHEEQIVFYSKESQFSPYLEITLEENEGGGCLIATATYGTELSPQVQNLRELRDNSLLNTESGRTFMELFNVIYYSFSPYIADYERENPVFRDAVKLFITPMVSSLSILNYVDMDSEESVLGYGISLILLNLSMYFVAPVMLFCGIRKHSKKN